MAKTISVVIPVYNEEENIEKSISTVIPVVSSIFDEFEIIIVEGGSTDGTLAKIERIIHENSQVKVVYQEKRDGLGNAIRLGFSNARNELIILMDCDNPFDLKELEKALPLLQEADVVAGYRLKRYDTILRAIYSKTYNFLIRNIFSLRIKDVNFCFRMYKRSIFETIKIESDSAFFGAEILIKARNAGFRIKEIGIHYTPRVAGKSKFDDFSLIFGIIYEMFTIGRQIIIKERHSISQDLNRLIDIYVDSGALGRLLIKMRYKVGLFYQLQKYIPREGKIVDLACGHGLFTNLLAIRSEQRKVKGIDLNEGRIEVARRTINSRKNIDFSVGDLKNIDLLNCDIITVIDVLHLIPYHLQDRLIRECHAVLDDKGTLIIATNNTRPRWRFIISYFVEFMLVRVLRLSMGEKFYYRHPESLLKALEKTGFAIEMPEVKTMWPFSYIHYLCRKTPDIKSYESHEKKDNFTKSSR